MVIHKEYALRRFCEVPLKHQSSKQLLELIWRKPDILAKLVFVVNCECLPNTMLLAQRGSSAPGFELQLSNETEHLTLTNGTLLREKRKTQQVSIKDPLRAWEVLQCFQGILHVQLAFESTTPDWYEEIVVPNEAAPSYPIAPGFSAFIREQIDLILWGITLREQIDQALSNKDEALFKEYVDLYKQVCRSCFWKLS